MTLYALILTKFFAKSKVYLSYKKFFVSKILSNNSNFIFLDDQNHYLMKKNMPIL